MNILFINSSRKWGGNENWTKLACESLRKKNNVYVAYRSNVIGKKINTNKIQVGLRHEGDLVTYLKLYSLIKKKKLM